MKYVISDIHGMYDKFIAMLSKINFTDKDTLYILGDIIDRGPKSLEMIQYVMAHDNIKFIIGNHEDLMINAIVNKDSKNYYSWISNGGIVTEEQLSNINNEELNKIMNFLTQQPYYRIVDNFILVHSGISEIHSNSVFNVDEFMKQQTIYDLCHSRDFYAHQSNFVAPYTVVFGHTPTPLLEDGSLKHKNGQEYKDFKIWNKGWKIGIDCGAPFTGGNVACLCLNNGQEFYVN